MITKRSEPKTLNPLTAYDQNSRDLIGLLMADLLHINRSNYKTEAALAKSWKVSADFRTYTLTLRRGLQFSDGHPFDADDVIFSFESYLDERVNSPQRELLTVEGVPIKARKLDPYTVAFTLAHSYAAAERLFDGIAILPRHLLREKAKTGELGGVWGLNTRPSQIAGLGPFRVKEYTAGQRIVLERNPYYWKFDAASQRLPYLDEIASEIAPNSDAEALRFDAGATDVISRISAANFDVLKGDERRRNFRLVDLGPGFEYCFLFFNRNSLPRTSPPSLRRKQSWFNRLGFRQAVAAAIDRESIVRLVYRGHALPLSLPIASANDFWVNGAIPPPARSIPQARGYLRQAGFSWTPSGLLQDPGGKLVEFSILVNTNNTQQQQIAVMIQADLKELGISVSLDSFEYRTFLHHIFTSYDYDAAILTLADADADPNTEIGVLTSTGGNHVWSLKPAETPSGQKEIDSLMQMQLIAVDSAERKRRFDRVQELVWKDKSMIFLVSPNILVGAQNRVGNFRPALLPDYTLWNADQLFLRPSTAVKH